jgi:hypothetical protein
MESRRQTRQARAFFRPTPGAGRGIGPQGARSAFSGCCSQSEPIFPVGNLPAQHKAAQPNRHHLCHAEPLHATPKCYFSRAADFPKAPVTAPPVCIPFADAFQRLLTAHRKPGLCVVCLPAMHATSMRLGENPRTEGACAPYRFRGSKLAYSLLKQHKAAKPQDGPKLGKNRSTPTAHPVSIAIADYRYYRPNWCWCWC